MTGAEAIDALEELSELMKSSLRAERRNFGKFEDSTGPYRP